MKQKQSKHICSFSSGPYSKISVALSHSSYSDFFFLIQVKTRTSFFFFHALQPFPSLPEPYQPSLPSDTMSVLEVFSSKEAVMLQSRVLCLLHRCVTTAAEGQVTETVC